MQLLVAALACTAATPEPTDSITDTGTANGTLDLRQEFPSAPDGGIEIRSPEFEIPPYTESLMCYYGTYTGPTIGVAYMAPLSADYSHHNQLKAVPANDPALDGDLVDCQSTDLMSVYVPLFEAVGIEPSAETADGDWLDLPDGVAMKLREGQRWVLDMHYINTTDQTLLVNNGVNLDSVPVESVTAWASALQFDNGGPQLAPGKSTTDSFTCAFEEDMQVLSLLGHMHKRGTSYAMDYTDSAGQTSRVYDIPEWDGGYYPYYPLILSYLDGEFPVAAGDSITTTCSWFNETDQTLGFPDEMCTTVVVVTPLEDPRSCIRGTYQAPV